MPSRLADLSYLFTTEEQRETSRARYDRLNSLIIQSKRGDSPIARTIRFLEKTSRENLLQMFYFGGFIRDLWLERQPRDIDIVVSDYSDQFENIFGKFIERKNKFGGYKLKINNCTVDAWHVGNTYSFKEGFCLPDSPSRLPETTFFNVESIVFEVWARDQDTKMAWERGFFKACETKTLDLQGIQSLSNPFPALQLARAYNLHKKLGWKFGPKLQYFVKENLPKYQADVQDFFLRHFGTDVDIDDLSNTLKALSNTNPKT